MANVQDTQTSASQRDPAGDDPFGKLHYMSRTAGAGTQEYVAVNSVAVAALLLGLGSALALVDRILLVVPLAAIVCTFVALYQISHSGGTQTGRLLAWVGLLLALGFMGAQVAKQVVGGMRTRADAQAINALMQTFGSKLAAEDFQGAYDMLGSKFHERVKFEQFANQFKARFRHPAHGKIKSIRSNELLQFEQGETGANRLAAATAIVTLEQGEDRQPFTFSKTGETWSIEDLSGWFQPAPAAARRSN